MRAFPFVIAERNPPLVEPVDGTVDLLELANVATVCRGHKTDCELVLLVSTSRSGAWEWGRGWSLVSNSDRFPGTKQTTKLFFAYNTCGYMQCDTMTDNLR